MLVAGQGPRVSSRSRRGSLVPQSLLGQRLNLGMGGQVRRDAEGKDTGAGSQAKEAGA